MTKFDPAIHDDNPPMDPAFLSGLQPSMRGRPKLDSPKVEVKIRLDAETVMHLRNSGPGWQTRVNSALRQLVTNGVI